MEIPLLCYQTISFDQIRSHYALCLPCPLPDQKLFNRIVFKCGNPFDKFMCFASLNEGLHPRRPMPKPNRVEIEVKEERVGFVSKSSEGLCSQIEELVLFGRFREALDLFEMFQIEGGIEVGSSTFDALVSACIGLRWIRGAKRVFSYMVSNGFQVDLYMRNRVLLMYVKCGMMIDARKCFDEMSERNLVSWVTMISGLVDVGSYMEAFKLFLTFWEESDGCGSRMLAMMIRASAGLGLKSAGMQLHSCALKMGIEGDLFISCALIDMYSKCGSIEDAHFVFNAMSEKTTVGWNTIIAGYALNGYSKEALNLFYKMHDSGIRFDHFTFSMIVRVCARLASVENAKQAHAALIRHGYGKDIIANTALVDLYSKWGRIEDAQHVFDSMPCKNVISWNALIAGYGNHGRGIEAIDLFEQMLQERTTPNHVTFLAVLSACSRSGLSEYGWEIFQSMGGDFKTKPRAMHYGCMIELLGKEGRLDEAFALIRGAPFKPTGNMWAALLTACRVHGNLEMGKFAAEKLYGIEPEKLSNYVVLWNIYNSAGKLKEADDVLQTLKRKGLKMLPACSWIEIRRQQQTFLSGDKRHPQSKEIYQKVDSLMSEISKLGYVHEERTLLPDVDEQETDVLFYHSEKLTIAFGLINSPAWVPLQIVQGHRICDDCHSAIKLLTTVTGREIVFKDGSRFHHFKKGSCSCGDYW